LRRPFDVGNADAIAGAVVSGGHLPVSHFRSDVPEALDRLITRAMSRRPGERPESARAMLTELTRIAQKLDPVTAPDVGGWARSAVEDTPPEPLRRRTATMSAVPGEAHPGKATATFVVRQSVDGVTVLDKEAVRPSGGRRGTVAAGLLLGVALFAAGSVARRAASSPAPSRPSVAPSAPSPPAPSPDAPAVPAAPTAPPSVAQKADPPRPPRPAR